MPSFPFRPLQPTHSFPVARPVLWHCLPLCLGGALLCTALLLAASPASAASLHDFATRWGKATISAWPPAQEAPLPPSANGTRHTVAPAEGAHNGTATRNATTPVLETKEPLPHPASSAINATAATASDTKKLTAPVTAVPANATAPSVGGSKNVTAPATATPAASAGDTAAPVRAQEPRPQTNRAQPAPDSRPPGALPDGMPSSPLGNGTLLTAPAATPRT